MCRVVDIADRLEQKDVARFDQLVGECPCRLPVLALDEFDLVVVHMSSIYKAQYFGVEVRLNKVRDGTMVVGIFSGIAVKTLP
jgi:hypothetical protein